MYLHTLRSVLIFSIFAIISCSSAGSDTAEPAGTTSEMPPSEALAKASVLYNKRDDLANAKKAIEILGKGRDSNNRNYDVEWKFARYSYFLGSRRTLSDEEAAPILKNGLEAARIALRMKPGLPDGHFWYAAILGEQSRRSPVTVGVPSIGKVRASLNKVIEIDKNYEGASVYDALGQIELESRGLAGGSAEKAVEFFKKGIELNPDNSYLHLHLGEAYLALNKDSDAKAHLRKVLSIKPAPDFIPEYKESEERARKLLEEKF
ncbi:MAG: tetratricopeptide repeat protein [Acidobacteria bacterium]|nr:tetratricopeptide repeat protein [Acidobacteriota bacterium]